MATKINKEFLLKNRFWIGLGVFVALWLIGVVVVETSGDEAKKKDWEKAKQTIEKAKSANPKTAAFQTPWNKHGEKFRKHKDVIWKQAWEQQASVYTWPDEMAVKPAYPEIPFGADPRVDVNNRGNFRSQYPEQFQGLESFVYPVEFNGGFESVFLPQEWRRDLPPTREEIWLAQEDFWVRREMLGIVREALDAVALFREEKLPEAKLPPGIVGRKRFKNANWELTFLFAKSTEGGWVISEKSTIKNINVTRKVQTLANPTTNKGLPFKLYQGSGSYVLRIAGEPLAFQQETTFKQTYTVEPVKPEKEFSVEQVLDWDISPIRRINILAVGVHSHRTFIAGLKIREDLKNLDPEQTADATPGASGKPGPGEPGKPQGGPPPGGAPQGSTPSPDKGGPGGPRRDQMAGDPSKRLRMTRVNEIVRARYMQVTPQCRHLPIGMTLIVDQAHIHDVLAAVANSRLRIQITQICCHHVANLQRGVETKTGNRRPGRRGGKGEMDDWIGYFDHPRDTQGRLIVLPGGRRGGGLRRTYGRLPGEGGKPSDPIAGKEDKFKIQDNARLVELTVYGLATLYERYPPIKKEIIIGK
jgi:hypothetical protein